MFEFRLESRKAGQPVGAFVEEMTRVGFYPFPLDVFSPVKERIDSFYQVIVGEWAALSFSSAFLSPPVEQISEDVYHVMLRLDQQWPVGMCLKQLQHGCQLHAVVGRFRVVSPSVGPLVGDPCPAARSPCGVIRRPVCGCCQS